MSVAFNSECLLCHLGRYVKTARSLGTEEQVTAFSKDLLKLYLSAPEGVGSPWFGPGTQDLLEKHYGVPHDRFVEEKAESNRFVLTRLDQIREKVVSAKDPVFAGLQMAVLAITSISQPFRVRSASRSWIKCWKKPARWNWIRMLTMPSAPTLKREKISFI